MRRRTIFRMVTAGALVAATATTLLRRNNEPSYNGLPLSYCIRALVRPATKVEDPPKAAIALGHVDSNGIPYLLKWIRYEKPKWKEPLAHLVFHLHPSVAIPITRWIRNDDREALAEGSVYGFALLNDKADCATVALSKMIGDPNAPTTASRAISALQAIGTTNAIAKLVDTIENPLYSQQTVPINGEAAAVRSRNNEPGDNTSNAVRRLAPDLLTNSPAQ